MIGQKVLEINKRENIFNIDNTDFFQINNFTCNNKFYDINISLQKGEILGLSGLLGSGTSDLLRSIFGIIKEDSGDIIYKKNKLVIKSPKDSISFGIGYLPSDRKNEGLIQDNSVRDNSVLTIFKTITNLGFFSSNNAKRITNEFVQKLQVKVSDINTSVMNLSGGNQQKIVIAKWLAKNCDILLFDDPTRGIDVAAKYQIWNLISEFSNNGGSVIVASNEIPELINGCDRIITMNKGKITKTFSKNDFNEEKISLNISSNIN
jgi:ribose transport system ATP-binding protein